MWHLYLDQSGDLGFDFNNKNSSRYRTIAILATSQQTTVAAIRHAVKRTLRRKVNGKKKNETELKGSNSTLAVKKYFYRQISAESFGIYALTLDKSGVKQELHAGAEMKQRLYNFIARKVLDKVPFEDVLKKWDRHVAISQIRGRNLC